MVVWGLNIMSVLVTEAWVVHVCHWTPISLRRGPIVNQLLRKLLGALRPHRLYHQPPPCLRVSVNARNKQDEKFKLY